MRIAVVGGGIIGLAVTRELQLRGYKPICFDPAPGCGSSTGDGRIFRLAHGDGALVNLAIEVQGLWQEWERQTNLVFLQRQGLLVCGEVRVQPYEKGLRDAGVAHSLLSASDGSKHLPWVTLGETCLFDPAGGFTDAALAISWVLAETEGAQVRQSISSIDVGAAGVSLNGGEPFERVLLCAGAATVPLASTVGISLPDHHSRHIRFAHQCPPGRWPALLHYERDHLPYGAYGVSLADGLYGVGVGWSDPPAKRDWSLERTVAHHAAINHEYRNRAMPSLSPTGNYVQCLNNHWPFPPGRQFAVWQNKGLVVFGGNDHFKFGPLLGRDLADVLLENKVPEHLGPVVWPEQHPTQDTEVIFSAGR